MIYLGNNLKRFRESNNMTQQEAAEKLFVTRQCISRWETGKTIPDIDSIKKLAEIYQVSIDEVLDEATVKMITVQDTRELKRWKKYVKLFSVVTLILIFLGFLSILWINDFFKANDNAPILRKTHAEIVNINQQDITMDIHDMGELTFNFSEFKGVIHDFYLEVMTYEDFLLGDVILISYSGQLIIKLIEHIQVLDHYVESNLYGILFNTTGIDYDDFDELPLETNPSGLRYVKLSDLSIVSWSHNVQIQNYSYVISDINAFRKKIDIDITIYMDYRLITKNTKIGLLTSEGIVYVETINPHFNTSRQYVGELNYTSLISKYSSSGDVIFNVSFVNVASVETFIMYEYDINHLLIQSTSFDDAMDLMMHRVKTETIYTYIRLGYYESKTYGFHEVKHVFVGDGISFYTADEFGLVWKNTYKVR